VEAELVMLQILPFFMDLFKKKIKKSNGYFTGTGSWGDHNNR